jgi:penicillin-binding protein 2
MQKLMPFQGWRLTLFQGAIFAIFLIFSLRMYQLQLVENEFHQARADENRLSELPIAAPRGIILDRNDTALAVNSPAYNVTIIPAALPINEEEVLRIYNRLSALTEVPPTAAVAAASGSEIRSIEDLVVEGEGIAPYRAVTIAEDIPHNVMMQILEERISLPGVDVAPASVRNYPTGQLTAQIVGYMGRIPAEQELELIAQGYNPAFDRVGYAGIEAYLENFLRGVRGRVVTEVDVAGRPIGNPIESISPQPGLNMRLTIDVELQQAAEQALINRINLLNATEGRVVSQTGSVIAMNPSTGEILAMVSYPTYDNSRFARTIDVPYYLSVEGDPLRPLINHATQSIYPPGSVWKLITALGALQEDVIDPNSTLFDAGDLLLPNRYAPNDTAASQRFVCWLDFGHGALNMIGGIAQSCDVYFYQIGGGNPEVSEQVLRPGGLGPFDLFRYATAFGIGSKLGVELPFENASRMPEPDWKRRLFGENWSTGDTYNAAFGQGYVNVTPLQMITATAAIANGGILYQPTLIRDFSDSDGETVRGFEPEVVRSLNIDLVPLNEPLVLLPLEDMIMRGGNSLLCSCEPDSEFFNPNRCNPSLYRAEVDVNPDPFLETFREYRVHVPINYAFQDGFCDEVRFDADYRPPFATTENINYVRQGMRAAVTIGTATNANLPFIEVAGKTGTAEYCDEIAQPLGLCRPGNWPAHAWFSAYAPYNDAPEIIIQAFVYNGGEGSQIALPIVVETMEAYLRLRNERQDQGLPAAELSAPPSAS